MIGKASEYSVKCLLTAVCSCFNASQTSEADVDRSHDDGCEIPWKVEGMSLHSKMFPEQGAEVGQNCCTISLCEVCLVV